MGEISKELKPPTRKMKNPSKKKNLPNHIRTKSRKIKLIEVILTFFLRSKSWDGLLLRDTQKWKPEVLQVVPRPTASMPQWFVQIDILRPHPRPTKAGTGSEGKEGQARRPCNLCCNKPPRVFRYLLLSENLHCDAVGLCISERNPAGGVALCSGLWNAKPAVG